MKCPVCNKEINIINRYKEFYDLQEIFYKKWENLSEKRRGAAPRKEICPYDRYDEFGCCSDGPDNHYSIFQNLNSKIIKPYKRDYFYNDKITVSRYFPNLTMIQIHYKCKQFNRVISNEEAVEFLQKYHSLLLML